MTRVHQSAPFCFVCKYLLCFKSLEWPKPLAGHAAESLASSQGCCITRVTLVTTPEKAAHAGCARYGAPSCSIQDSILIHVEQPTSFSYILIICACLLRHHGSFLWPSVGIEGG